MDAKKFVRVLMLLKLAPVKRTRDGEYSLDLLDVRYFMAVKRALNQDHPNSGLRPVHCWVYVFLETGCLFRFTKIRS